MGRQPLGRRPMTEAEKQKRYRARKRKTKAVKHQAERLIRLQARADADSAAAAATVTVLAGTTKRFPVIVADAPWRFGTPYPKGDRCKAPYSTLPTEEICRLIPPAATNALLCLWVLPHMSHDAHQVIDAWGFAWNSVTKFWQPASKLYWLKKEPDGPSQRGKGYRALEDQVEEFWICTRGQFVAPMPGKQFKQGYLIEQPREHSRKPDEFYKEIERLYPNCARLEMFARPPFRPSWWVSGDEVPGGLMFVPPVPA
jgi:N6-adenosine-specific RNA methylase IME4